MGDFVASFVPSMKDFSRLDKQFVIPEEIWRQIPEYVDYGFAVFQLKKLEGTPHPMAFEFATRLKEKIFFPTVHIHDGKVHDKENFHHTLYLQHAGDGVREISNLNTAFMTSTGPLENFVNINETKGVVEANLYGFKADVEGMLPNKDVIVEATNSPTKRVLPVGIGVLLAGLAWVIRRRQVAKQI